MNSSRIVDSRRPATHCKLIAITISCLLVTAGVCQQAIAAETTATWNPGSGNWTDPHWTFSPPSTAPFPKNSADEFFNVLIDSGAPGNSEVTLSGSTPTPIDRLQISSGDGLKLSGGVLSFTQDAARPGSGALVNSGSIAGNGVLKGAGPGSGTMMLNNNRGSIIANTGSLTVNPSGFDGTTSPPVVIQNSGEMGALGVGGTLLLKNSFVEQSGPGSVSASLGGKVVLEDSVIHGGAVTLVGSTPPPDAPVVRSTLELNRGSIEEGTNLRISQGSLVQVGPEGILASTGGVLPAQMAIQGGSVFVNAWRSPIEPNDPTKGNVTLTLDSGPGDARVIDFSNPLQPNLFPGSIITNISSASLRVEGNSIIKIVEGNVALANPLWPGGAASRGGIFLNGAEPSAARIVSDTGTRTLTVGRGTVVTNMPERSGNIGPIIGAAAPVVIAKGNSPDGGLVAANTGGRLEIGELRNEGGMVQALSGGTLALGNEMFPNSGEVHVFSGGTLALAGDYQQIAESTLIEGTANVERSYIQTGGMTTIGPGGVLSAQNGVEVQGGRFTGDILSDFILDGSWDIEIRGLNFGDYDHVTSGGFPRIAAGSTILVDLLFDAQAGDFFDVLIADLINEDDLHNLVVRGRRHFTASIEDVFNPLTNQIGKALRLTVPEPPTALLVSLIFPILTRLPRRLPRPRP